MELTEKQKEKVLNYLQELSDIKHRLRKDGKHNRSYVKKITFEIIEIETLKKELK